MKRTRTTCRLERVALLAGLVTAGCAVDGDGRRRGSELAAFAPAGAIGPRVVVYGGLDALLPHFDPTPALERWLYGPSDFGRTMLRNPQGMTLATGRLLVCDQGLADIVAVDLTTGKSVPWADPNHPPRCPVDVTTDAEGRVYVADTTLGSVIVYAGGGTYVEELTPAPTFRPTAVLVVDGMLLVGDAGGRALARWNIEQRIWLEPWTPPGMIAPVGLAADADGNFLIADAVAGQVFRVTSDGRRLTPLGRAGRGPGEFVRPKQVCATQSGLILVVDAGRQSLIVFSHDGTYVTEIHERVDGWRGWTLPMGVITLDPSLLPELDRPDTCVLVSDSLGAPSLTVLGVLEGSSPKTADVR